MPTFGRNPLNLFHCRPGSTDRNNALQNSATVASRLQTIFLIAVVPNRLVPVSCEPRSPWTLYRLFYLCGNSVMGVDLDKWIEKIKKCEVLEETELRALCEHVSCVDKTCTFRFLNVLVACQLSSKTLWTMMRTRLWRTRLLLLVWWDKLQEHPAVRFLGLCVEILLPKIVLWRARSQD